LKNSDYKIIVLKPSNIFLKIPNGKILSKALIEAGINLTAICGEQGKCGKCKVKLLSKKVPYTLTEEMVLTANDIRDNTHLACQIIVDSDLEIEILHHEFLDYSNKLEYEVLTKYEIDDHLKKRYIELDAPVIATQFDDLQNIENALFATIKNKKLHISLSLLQNLSTFLRKNNYHITLVTIGNELINFESGDTTSRKFGLAFDLGTTTIAGILIDLHTGEDVAVFSKTNPQHIYGADVISRINYSVNEPGGLNKLQNLVTDAINNIIEALSKSTGVSYREIYEVSLAGNAVMNHIFLGVNPQYIGIAPYIPTFRECSKYSAAELGLTLLPNAPVNILPNISAYVGGDTTGFILSCEIHKSEKITLGIDIGTNGEIVLGNKNRLLCTSAAAGPAFEGGHISSGMRAKEGAIKKVVFGENEIFYEIIGNGEPKGICGTGLIDVVAEMLKAGIINQNGQICKPKDGKDKWHNELLIEDENGLSFIVIPAEKVDNKEPIVITQKDIRELQLAKAAIAAAIIILMHELKITDKDIEEVLIAGAFGNYINKYNAQIIGLIPHAINLERIKFVGNAAISGAKKYLLSEKVHTESFAMIRNIEYIELSNREEFQNEFTDCILFENQ